MLLYLDNWVICLAIVLLLVIAFLGTHKTLRLPLYVIIWTIIWAQLAVYWVVRTVVKLLEVSFYGHRFGKLRKKLRECNSRAEFESTAKKLDTVLGKDKWKKDPKGQYNFEMIQSLTNRLQNSSKSLQELITEHFRYTDSGRIDWALCEKIRQECSSILDLIDSSLHSHVLGVVLDEESLYSLTHCGTKETIVDFFDTIHKVLDTIEYVSQLEDKFSSFNVRAAPYVARLREKTITMFAEMSRRLGKVALCLSGGACMGHYHFGVIKGLFEEGLLPKIFSGTSAGAVMAAAICVRTDEELPEILSLSVIEHMNSFEDSWLTLAKRFWKEGVMYDRDIWYEKLSYFTNGDMTFLEAYERSGRILNISVSSAENGPPMLLNYVSAPNVIIRSAVLASAAVPLLVRPVTLMEKHKDGSIHAFQGASSCAWFDGSYQCDLPLSALAEQFNVSYCIVSQVNPHVIPFFFRATGQCGEPTRWRSRSGGFRGGFILSALECYLKLEMVKNLKLMTDLNLWPKFIGREMKYVFIQGKGFEGHITIAPKVRVRDYFTVLSDPSPKDLEYRFKEGQRMIWRKLSLVELKIKLHQHLDSVVETLKKKKPFTHVTPKHN